MRSYLHCSELLVLIARATIAAVITVTATRTARHDGRVRGRTREVTRRRLSWDQVKDDRQARRSSRSEGESFACVMSRCCGKR